jgi:sulfur carrier protein ThiS
MNQRSYRAQGYLALSKVLESWRQLQMEELVARVGLPARSCVVEVEGQQISVDVSAEWTSPKRDAVRVQGVANSPNNWQIERVEEGFTVSLKTSKG